MSATTGVPVFDAFAPEHRPDPYPRYALVREAVPFLDSGLGVEFVTRHAECTAVLTETLWSHRDEAELFHPDADRADLPTSFLWMDPPDHTRLRGLVSKAFTPRRVVGAATADRGARDRHARRRARGG